jgi:hypothetical protein
MTDERDPAVVLAKLAALSRERQNDSRVIELWPDSLSARIRECERLANSTMYPEMAAIMRKLVSLWREVASSLPPSSAANDR